MSPLGRVLTASVVILALAIVPVVVAGAQKPIRIGASMSQTGSLAVPGQNMLRGYQLCVKHVNEKGGVLGRRIDERLITQDKVDAILGPYSSPITEVMADVPERHRMPMVAAGAAATSIFTRGRKYVFGIHSPAEAYLRGLIEVAASRGLKTVAVIYENTLLFSDQQAGRRDLRADPGRGGSRVLG